MTQAGNVLDVGRWLEDPGGALVRAVKGLAIMRVAGRATLPRALAILGPLMAGALRREGEAPALDLTLDALALDARTQTLNTLLELHGRVTGPSLSRVPDPSPEVLRAWPAEPGLLTDLTRVVRLRRVPRVPLSGLDAPGEVRRAVTAWAGGRPVYHGRACQPLLRWDRWLDAESLADGGAALSAAALVVHALSGTLPGVPKGGRAGLDGLAARVRWLTHSGRLTGDADALLLGHPHSFVEGTALSHVAMLTPPDWLPTHWETLRNWVTERSTSRLLTRRGQPKGRARAYWTRVTLTAPLGRRDLTPSLTEHLAQFATRPALEGGAGESEASWVERVAYARQFARDTPDLTRALLPPAWRARAQDGGVPEEAVRVLMRRKKHDPEEVHLWGKAALALLQVSAAQATDAVPGPGERGR